MLLDRLQAVFGSDLGPYEKLVLVAVTTHGEAAWPSQGRLASMCGLSERTIRRCLTSIVSAGWLEAEFRPGRTTIYRPRTPATQTGVNAEPRSQVPGLNVRTPVTGAGVGGANPGHTDRGPRSQVPDTPVTGAGEQEKEQEQEQENPPYPPAGGTRARCISHGLRLAERSSGNKSTSAEHAEASEVERWLERFYREGLGRTGGLSWLRPKRLRRELDLVSERFAKAGAARMRRAIPLVLERLRKTFPDWQSLGGAIATLDDVLEAATQRDRSERESREQMARLRAESQAMSDHVAAENAEVRQWWESLDSDERDRLRAEVQSRNRFASVLSENMLAILAKRLETEVVQ